MGTVACNTGPHPMAGEEFNRYARVSAEGCAADTKSLEHLLVIASKSRNSSHEALNAGFTVLWAAPVKEVGKTFSEFMGIWQKCPFPKASCKRRTFLLSRSFGREQSNSCTDSWVMKTDRALPVCREYKWCPRDWLVCNMQMQIYPGGITTTKCLAITMSTWEVVSRCGLLSLRAAGVYFLSERVLVVYPLSSALVFW